ncbi:MAG TPA: MFS transporter [candidate division Zixibacteria bacterium]|nr:MFS transporter [candidate division Zixibacteria bacterium]
MNPVVVISNLVFVLVGVATTMLGPLLPVHAARFGLSDQQLGSLFLAQFFGGFAGSIVSTELTKRCGLRTTIRLGLAVVALGILGTTVHSLHIVLVSIALYGIGIGFCSPTITAAVSDASPANAAAALNVLNFSWGVGAIVAAPLLTHFSAVPRVGFIGTMAFVTALLAISAALYPKLQEKVVSSTQPDRQLSSGLLRFIIATGAVIFVYVGVENGVAGWLPTLADRVHHFSADRRAVLQGTFWTAFLGGRLLAPLVLRRISEKTVLQTAIVLGLVGTLGIIVAHGPVSLFAAVSLTAFGFAPIFPTTIAFLSQRLHGQAGARLGWMFAAAGLGGAVVPYCVGYVSTITTRLLLGFSTLVLAELLLVVVNFITSAQARRLQEPEKASISAAC